MASKRSNSKGGKGSSRTSAPKKAPKSTNSAPQQKRTNSSPAPARAKESETAKLSIPAPLVVGIVLLVLAFLSLMYCGGDKSVFTLLIGKFEARLFGYAQPVFGLALAGIAVELFLGDRLKHPIRKLVLTALLPILLAALFHVFTGPTSFAAGFAPLAAMWMDTGLRGTSGGFLGGLLASSLMVLLPNVLAVLLLFFLLLVSALHITGNTLMGLVGLIRYAIARSQADRAARPRQPKPQYTPEDYVVDEATGEILQDPEPARHQPARAKPREKRSNPLTALLNRSRIDIPMDDDTRSANTLESSPFAMTDLEPEQERKMSSIFHRPQEDTALDTRSRPVAPAEVMTDLESKMKVRPADTADPEATIRSGMEEGQALLNETVAKPKGRRKRADVPAADPAAAQSATAPQPAAVFPGAAVPDADRYEHPGVELLKGSEGTGHGVSDNHLDEVQQNLSSTISSFGVDAAIIGRTCGPSVTRFELKLAQGVKLSTITNLSNDLALSLGVVSVRISPIPGKSSVVGIEVPNQRVSPVMLHDVIASEAFKNSKSPVAFAVGRDIANQNVIGDIARFPHVLIAGTTGAGKSVCVNSLLISLLYRSSPEDVRLIMVDPKMVELGIYNGIPHLLIPVVTDPKKAAGALQWAVYEMMRRYTLFSEHGVRDMKSYNEEVVRNNADPNNELMAKMASVVVVIDELADLMLVAKKEVEDSICRVAQMGRAAGMHLVVATQRPSKDVITGLMKANIPSRIAFAVASSLDSRIILDQAGAEKLVGKGDMLFAPLGIDKPMRVQGCLVTDEEVAKVTGFIKEHSAANYDEDILAQVEDIARNTGNGKGKGGAMAVNFPEPDDNAGSDLPTELDDMFPQAVDVILETGMASVSMLQRRLKLGYSRAARLVDQMEEKGVVGPFEGSKPRKVLITRDQWDEMKMRSQDGQFSFDQMDMARSMSAASDADNGFAGEDEA